MSGIEMVDMSNALPTGEDILQAIVAVERAMITSILELPPELAVNLPTIRRCLQMLYILVEKQQAAPHSSEVQR